MRSLIVFDMDGVLLNSELAHSVTRERILGDYGIRPPSTSAAGMPMRLFYANSVREYGLEADPIKLADRHFLTAFELIHKEGLGPSNGLMELLDAIDRRGISVRAVSSSPRSFTTKVMEYLGLSERLPCISYGEASRNHPVSDLYQETLALTRLPAKEVMAVDDSATGVGAASSLGIDCVGYINPTSGRQDLSAARWRVTRLTEIIKLL